MGTECSLYATTPRGLAGILARELGDLGAREVRAEQAGVSFSGSLEVAYRACLWSRCASRVLLLLARFPAPTPEALYAGVRRVSWAEHLAPGSTMAVHCTARSAAIRHTKFAALKVKDAVVDQLREERGARPSVDRRQPDVRLHLHLAGTWARLSLDLSGESLHRRGYRPKAAEAPLKEHLAAAVLRLAGWPEIAARGGALVDLLCGTGTLPVEAALMAGDVAPGFGRERFGFHGWRGHDPGLWERLLCEAQERALAGRERLPPIWGFDRDPDAVRAARESVRRAGLEDRVVIRQQELGEAGPPKDAAPGLVVANPPYGERLGEAAALRPLYLTLGRALAERFVGWQAGILTARTELMPLVGLPGGSDHALFNGAISCELRVARVAASAGARPSLSAGAGMFVDRLRKRARHLGRWARRQGIHCYRVYDADLPEYAVAVDRYEGFVHVQEYAPPRRVDPGQAARRLEEALAVVPEVLEVPREHVFVKIRRRQRGADQYERLGEGGAFHEVREGGHHFLVNLSDYLDTGLFLGQRLVRQLLAELAPGRRVLNLFGYTGSATVYAARAGARAVTTVDLSRTYLGWAERNLRLNGLDPARHPLVRADCLEWLPARRERWDLILLDPPTFSNSKRMQTTWDVQRDHATLILQAVDRLAPQGVLIFCTNRRNFRLDQDALADLPLEDLSRQTLPEDFRRRPQRHHCFRGGTA